MFLFLFLADLSKSTGGVKLDDGALVDDLIPEVSKVVNPKFTREQIRDALRDNDYVAEDAIRYLLDQEAYMDFEGNSDSNNDLFAMDVDDVKPDVSNWAKKGDDSLYSISSPLSETGRMMSVSPKKKAPILPSHSSSSKQGFSFNTPSPDDVALAKRAPSTSSPAKKASTKSTPSKKELKKSGDRNDLKSSTGGVNLKKSTPGVNLKSSTSGVNLKASTGGVAAESQKKQVYIRPEKRTKQLVHELMTEAEKGKERLNMVVIGHVDAGKSTLMGHLLHLLGNVDDRLMHKYKTTSEKEGKGSFAYAWVLDASEEERKRGVTIDVAQGHLETKTKSITLLDAPGHLDFVPNMIVGAAQADVALLVVDCTPSNFESGFTSTGQTKEHALLARSLGVKEMIVVINKMDSVQWDEQRYNFVKNEVGTFLTKNVGFRKAQLQYVPCSGHKGINIIDNKEPLLMKWYQGKTLVSLIDGFSAVEKDLMSPTRFYVTEVLGRGDASITGLGLSGKVESGMLSTGDQLLLLPVGQHVTVKSLKLQNGTMPHVCCDGDSLEIGVTGMSDDNIFGVGDILCDPQKPLTVVRKFRAQIVVFQPQRPLLKGDEMILHMHSVSVQCRLSRLRSIIDKKTGEVSQAKPRMLPAKCTAIVDIRLERPLCMELFSENKQFGRFMLRTGSKTIAAGIVTSVLKSGLKKRIAAKEK